MYQGQEGHALLTAATTNPAALCVKHRAAAHASSTAGHPA